MPEQVLKAPGYYDREIDLSAREVEPTGIPATVIGAAVRGPAFVPTTVGSYVDFVAKFGDVDSKYPATYAVQKFLDNREAAVFIRTLGAGANTTTTHFETTRTQGTVRNAGLQISGTVVTVPNDSRHQGSVQFLVAKHKVATEEVYGMPMFTDNASFTLSSNNAYLVRAVIFTAADARIMVFHPSESFANALDDVTTIDNTSTNQTYRKFKLAISTSAGASFASDDGFPGVRIYTASLDPTDDAYVGKLLNTDPEKFSTEKHYLYADFAVDSEIAAVASGSEGEAVGIFSGSANTSLTSGDTTQTFRSMYGRFDTRFTTPKTPTFISQPFGSIEYDLFQIESLDDGAYANNKYKVSIANLKASNDPKNEYGTFNVLIRNWDDTDFEPQIIEQFSNVTLDPNSDNYIAKAIGDKKVSYIFDAEAEDDRRLKKSGEYPLRSKYVRVVMSTAVRNGIVPAKALPFGFRGIETLNTNPLLTDATPLAASTRLAASGVSLLNQLSGSIVPPLPYRFKVTRGSVTSSANFTGEPGATEVTDTRLYWGVKFERNTNATNVNTSNEKNRLVESYTKFLGIKKLDALVTGSATDSFNSHKFTLARVALSNATLADITSSAANHMREAAYIRNGAPDGTNYYISDGSWGNRVTLATLLSKGTAPDFNKFNEYTKFTTVMYGGWDGVNILDKNAARFNDKATSTETGGLASTAYSSPGALTGTNYSGTGIDNNAVKSFRTALDIATDEITNQSNILAVPGQREPLVTDYALLKNSQNGLMFYIMDIPAYDSSTTRLFDGETGFISVEKTANQFDSRALDFRAAAAYFPNFIMDDEVNSRRVTVPASVAALAALGFNDKVAYPWWAPAGFNRGALDFVVMTSTKVNQPDRNKLFDARINPIIKFPGQGHVFLSQTGLQQEKTFLESINVVRMLLDIKRAIRDVGNRIIWENISPALRTVFAREATAILSTVQIRGGLEDFKVICDGTNNTDADLEANKIRAQIRVLPTRAIEYVSMDFIITPSGATIA